MSIFGLQCEEIGEDRYTGHQTLLGVDHSILVRLHGGCTSIMEEEVAEWDMYENEFLVLKNGSTSGLASIVNGKLRKVSPTTAYGIQPKNVEQVLAVDALLNDNIPLVSITGVAGTGKTLLAVAAAIECRRKYLQVLVSRPIMPMGKDIGYLPGSINEKISPYMAPLFDNLSIIKTAKSNGSGRTEAIISDMLDNGKLVLQPITYIRGRSFHRCFLIVDEAQNLTPHEVKTIVTRAGEGTKVVFTGDTDQIDHPKLDKYTNGLATLIEKMKGQSLYAHVHLTKSERSPLAKLAGEVL